MYILSYLQQTHKERSTQRIRRIVVIPSPQPNLTVVTVEDGYCTSLTLRVENQTLNSSRNPSCRFYLFLLLYQSWGRQIDRQEIEDEEETQLKSNTKDLKIKERRMTTTTGEPRSHASILGSSLMKRRTTSSSLMRRANARESIGFFAFDRECNCKNGIFFSSHSSSPEVLHTLINSRDSVDSTKRNDFDTKRPHIKSAPLLLEYKPDYKSSSSEPELTRLTLASTTSTSASTTTTAAVSCKRKATTNFIHEVRGNDQTLETPDLLLLSKDRNSNITKLDMSKQKKNKGNKTARTTTWTTLLLVVLFVMIFTDCIHLKMVTSLPDHNSQDENDSFWRHFSRFDSHETIKMKEKLKSFSTSSSSSFPSSSVMKKSSALDSPTSSVHDDISSEHNASYEYSQKQPRDRMTTNLRQSSDDDIKRMKRASSSSELAIKRRKARRSISSHSMLSESGSSFLIESDVDSLDGEVLDRNEEDGVKTSDKKKKVTAFQQKNEVGSLDVIKSRDKLYEDKESRELFMEDASVVSKRRESLAIPAKLLSRSSSPASGKGWDLFADQQIRLSLHYLKSHYSANAVLHFIELLATENETASSQSSEEKDWFCIRTSLNHLNFPLNSLVYKSYDNQAKIAVRTANLLTSLFMSGMSSSPTLFVDKDFFRRKMYSSQSSSVSSMMTPVMNESLSFDKSFFWALSQLNMQSDDKLSGAGIAFADKISFPIKINGKTSSSTPHAFFRSDEMDESGSYFAPFVSRPSGGSSPLSFIDLSLIPSSLSPSSSSTSSSKSYHKIDWFRKHATNRSLTEIDLNNFNNIFFSSQSSSRSQSSPSSKSRDSSHTSDSRHQSKTTQVKSDEDRVDASDGDWVHLEDGFWTSPYLDCLPGNNWQLTYSVPFFAPSSPSGHKITFR